MRETTLLLRLLCAGLLLVGAPRSARAEDPNEDKARAYLREGSELLQAGELLRARTAFAAALALTPERANPYRWLGLVDARLSRCKEAIPNLEAFLARVPADDPRVAEVVAARDRCKAELPAEPPVTTVTSAPKEPRRPLYKAWWLWTIVGVVAVGTGLGIGFGVASATAAPSSPYEPVRIH